MSEEVVNKEDIATPKTAIGAWARAIAQGFVYDEFGIKTEFQAKVLSRPILTTGKEAKIKEKVQHAKFMFKARILGNPSPHDYLPDPCDASIADDEEEALKVIGFHTTFISNSDLASAGHHAPKIGDIINVRLEPGRFSYDLQYGVHLGILNVNTATIRYPTGTVTEQKVCESLIALFGAGEISIAELGDVYGVRTGDVVVASAGGSPIRGAPAQSGVKFYKKLRGSVFWNGFSNNFLIGLMVNAQNESGRGFNKFVGDCTGGPRSLNIQGEGKCCSFAYWHLNICAGSGVPYIRWLDGNFKEGPGTRHPSSWTKYSDLTSDSEKYDKLVLDQNVFYWMSWHMKEHFDDVGAKPNWDDKDLTPSEWAGWISMWENCDGCQYLRTEYNQRQGQAADYAAGDLSAEVDTE